MNRKKHLLRTLFMVLMALIMIPCYSQAASQKSKAIKAYNKFLTQKTHVWRDTAGNTTEDYQTQKAAVIHSKNAKFLLAYVDKDSVPELVIFQNELMGSMHYTGQIAIYTYKSGKVKYLSTLRSLGKYDGKFPYYKKKGLVIDNNYSRGYDLIAYVKAPYKIYDNNDNYTFYLQKRIDNIDSGFTDRATGKTDYYSNGFKEISKKTFNSKLKKVVGNTKLTVAKFHSNTSANRKKYLK